MDFGAKMAPFWKGFGVQVGAKIDQKSFKKSIITFERNLEPTWSHIGPTYAPLGPNLAQLGPNLVPTWAQHGPKTPDGVGYAGPFFASKSVKNVSKIL